MTPSTWFITGLVLTAGVSLSVVTYLRVPLHSMLVELCGNANRARFWTAFSNITVTAMPVILAMQYGPVGGTSPVFELANQLKWGLIGLVISVVLLGWILSRFIPRVPVRENTVQDAA